MEPPVPGAEPPELPRGFLQSLRTLFDILDDERRGSVHVLEIESRWRRGGAGQALPPGVLQCLRRAAPASGYLTFERLVAGLRSALLSPGPGGGPEPGHSGEWKRPVGREQPWPAGSRLAGQLQLITSLCGGGGERQKPPLGVRSTNVPDGCLGQHRALAGDREQRAERREARVAPWRDVDRRHMTRCQSEAACSGIAYGRRQGRDRSELRRHTITSGADYSALKWMKELEQEKDALLQGLEMIDCARDWYLHHIQAIQDHQRSIGQSSADSGEAAVRSSGRLDQLLPKLQLVSRCLADLISCSAKPLARSSNPVNGSDPSNQASVPGLGNNAQVVSMLKEQNRQLTKEVTTKSERITQLEQEKSALIKQLFAARSRAQPENSQLDSTFI
ncbi:suppressor APC domain-containing protein 2 isoform X2 [Pristis pectinata]|uniref:suppressor APC domain-containing protein 2 isoform X2 n=1 Tax=Pristis pectinata TaxID=685728 RepID=UPI00223E0E15|nr:suppressor APC domain-containing protein 2 isoform X2 [Pristis pectinata]